MYCGFRLDGVDESFFEDSEELFVNDFKKDSSSYYKIGKRRLIRYRDVIETTLSRFVIGNDGELDGTVIQDNWFKQVSCDIFLSHSHKDEDLAIALAGWLYDKFKLVTFIDSCIWGYSEKLLRIIDNEFCLNDDKQSYSYKSRNQSTSHVHMMLNMALMQMIDKTECLFFLNTPNSISLSDIETRTLSPWIYSEIGMSQMIKKTIPERIKEKQFSKSQGKENLTESISYKVDTSHLKKISVKDLISWRKNFGNIQSKYTALDGLYDNYLYYRNCTRN